MISEKDFVSTLEKLKKKSQFEDDIGNVFLKYEESYPTFPSCIDEAVFALDRCFENNEDDWVGYWVFELDFGRRYHDGCVMTKDGEKIDISTPDKLYKFILTLKENSDE